ncbi:MAG TPA: hypothetical protein VI454_17725 [Verrucomicrobiae bacterium]|jgi:hypothetical protein
MNRAFNLSRLVCVLALAALTLDTGCRGRTRTRAPQLAMDTAFPTNAAPLQPAAVEVPADALAVQQQVAAFRQEVRTGDYLTAATRLRQLEASTNVTAPQLRAIHEATVVVQQRLAERAAKGDPAAKRAVEEYQNSLTR